MKKVVVQKIGGTHGVSCDLPKLEMIEKFERGEIFLSHGYPRFVPHEFLRKLARKISAISPVILTCSQKSAQFLIEILRLPEADFLITGDENFGAIILRNNLHEKNLQLAARNFGFLLSSRAAEKILKKEKIENNFFAQKKIKKILQKLEKNFGEVFLFPSGMAAIATAIFVAAEKNSAPVLIGNPYVDTRDIFRNFFPQTIFMKIYENLENFLEKNTSLIFLEFPTNPLLRVANLKKIIEIAHRREIPVAVDSTIATPHNFNPAEFGADIILHSTTKFLNGQNNSIGGALLLNENSKFKKNLSKKIFDFKKNLDLKMCDNEAEILLENILPQNFAARMEKINFGAEKVAEFLAAHEKIEKIFFPKLRSHSDFFVAKNLGLRGCGLVSFILKKSSRATAAKFYDNLLAPILRGPSLGAEQTLLCPYEMLANFFEPAEILRQNGSDKFLFRISVGCENPEKIIAALDFALQKI